MRDDQRARTVLFVHANDELYGGDMILLQLVDGLDQRLFRPIVVLPNDVPGPGPLSAALSQSRVRFIKMDLAVLRRAYFSPFGCARYTWRLFRSTIRLVGLIWRESVDVVHSNTAAVLPGALAAPLTRRSHIWHVHDIIKTPRFLWRLTSWLMPRLSQRVVAVSTATWEHLCLGDPLNRQKAIVIPNGIDTRHFDQARGLDREIHAAWGVAPGQPLIGMIGRISRWKGQADFLRAACRVLEQCPDARFAVVGGTVAGQEHLARRHGAGGAVRPGVGSHHQRLPFRRARCARRD